MPTGRRSNNSDAEGAASPTGSASSTQPMISGKRNLWSSVTTASTIVVSKLWSAYQWLGERLSLISEIPFSKLTAEDISNLFGGTIKLVNSTSHKLLRDPHFLNVLQLRDNDVKFLAFWEDSHRGLSSPTMRTKFCLTNIGIKREARAHRLRIGTDEPTIVCNLFLSELSDTVSINFLEIPVTDKSNFVTVEWNGIKTRLTGVFDYLIATWTNLIPSQRQNLMVQARARAGNSATEIQRVYNPPPAYFIIEEKLEKLDADLSSHFAQIFGKCLAVMAISGKPACPWCLSTGTEYIFGVVRETLEGPEMLRLPLFELRDHDLKDDLEKITKILIIINLPGGLERFLEHLENNID